MLGKSVWSYDCIHANCKEIMIENKRCKLLWDVMLTKLSKYGFFLSVCLFLLGGVRATWKKWAEVHTARAARLFHVITFWRARFAGHRCCLNFALLCTHFTLSFYTVQCFPFLIRSPSEQIWRKSTVTLLFQRFIVKYANFGHPCLRGYLGLTELTWLGDPSSLHV